MSNDPLSMDIREIYKEEFEERKERDAFVEVLEAEDITKWRIYVDHENQIPDWAADTYEGERGGIYYVVGQEELAQELLTPPMHEVDRDFPLEDYIDVDRDEVDEGQQDITEYSEDDIDGGFVKRTFRIYVDSASKVPDWAEINVGSRGGVYYVVYSKEMFDELMSSPKHQLPDDFLDRFEYGEDYKASSKTEKRRIYIDDTSEAPDGKKVHRGDKGGVYYEVGEDSNEEDDENDDIDFPELLRRAVEDGSVTDIPTKRFGGNIDKITDTNILSEVYRQDNREAVRREVREWGEQLDTSFEYDYRERGPLVTEDVSVYSQVHSLTDADLDDFDLESEDKKALDEWEELCDTTKDGESVDFEERRKFRKKAEDARPEVLFYLWEKGLKTGFTDLNTHLANLLEDEGYSPRTEKITGTVRRLELKYGFLNGKQRELAELLESDDCLKTYERQEWVGELDDIENVDFLNDIKRGLIQQGISKDDQLVNTINRRIGEINPKPIESTAIDPDTYRKIVDRPAGFQLKGDAMHKEAWQNVFENVSNGDLFEFVDVAQGRGNYAHASIVRGLLCYRRDAEIDSRDMVSISFDGGDISEEELFQSLERILANLCPSVGAHLLSYVSYLRSDTLSTPKEAEVLTHGSIGIDGNNTEDIFFTEELLSHCVGHIISILVGLDGEEEEHEDNQELDDLGFTVLQPKNDDNKFAQEFYEKLRMAWTRYTSQDRGETRIYQRTSPTEFLASTFALWITDSVKLQVAHSELVQLYEVSLGDIK